MLKVRFIGTALFIEDYDSHLTNFTAYTGKSRTITIHDITDADLDALINALIREEHGRQQAKEEK